MAGSFRGRKLVVAFPGEYNRQSAFGVALNVADIDTRHPQSAPTYPGKTVTREEIRDCSGEYLIREDITSQFTRLAFSFDADARLIAGWLAYAQGLAAAPTGDQVAEVWEIEVTGTPTAGVLAFSHTFEGITDSVDIPFDATAPEIQALLETVRTLKKGNVTVAGTLLAGPVVITNTGRGAAGDISQPTVNDSGLTDATAAISTATPGTNKTAIITRTTLDQNPLLSIIVGFEDDTDPPVLYRDMVVNSITINGALRGKVTVDLELVGSADTEPVLGYVFPDCVNIDPIYTRDCRVRINNVFVVENLREFSYTYSNNVFTGDDAFPYDDIDVVRLEHGDRTSEFTFSIYGSPGDAEYGLAEVESIVPVELFLGPPVQRVEIDAPKTSLRLEESPITFAGEAGRSAFGIRGVPFFDQSVAGTPDNVVYYGPETVTLLDV